MEEAPENGKESPHSAHANGMNDKNKKVLCIAKFHTCRIYIEKLIPRSILSILRKLLNLLLRSEDTDMSVNIRCNLFVNSYPHAC